MRRDLTLASLPDNTNVRTVLRGAAVPHWGEENTERGWRRWRFGAPVRYPQEVIPLADKGMAATAGRVHRLTK